MKLFMVMLVSSILLITQVLWPQIQQSDASSGGVRPAGNAPADPGMLSDPLYARAKRANSLYKFHADRDYGTVDIISNVEDAHFFIGTHYVGKTPIQGLRLPKGKYETRVTLTDYDDVVGSMEIKPAKKVTLNLYLNRKKGMPVVKTKPTGVKVSISGSVLGTTGPDGLMLGAMGGGTYLVKLEKAGHIMEAKSLKVVDGKITGLNVYMRPNYGSVRVESNKDDSYVYVNNIYFGRSPIVVKKLRPGRTEVKVEKEKHAPFIQNIVISPGSMKRVKAILKKDRSFRDMGPYGELKGSWGDEDGDGLPNKSDNCVEDPEDIDGFKDQDGCPDMDNDYDGISDIKEMDNKYRDMPEDFDGFEDHDGKPDFDNDGDYVPDSADLCAFTPEDRDGFEDLDGCPDWDNDGDKVPDSTDLSPNDPEDIDGFQDKDGAPDLDNDNDGIKDFVDRCPKESEIFNNFQDDDGCPDVRIPKPKPGLIKNVRYDLKEDFGEMVWVNIDSAYNYMAAYSDVKILIKVHSDGKGRKRRKLKKTREKAEQIARYMDYRGVVDKNRYRVKGVGGSDPIASNVSKRGRAKNTRIEIRRAK